MSYSSLLILASVRQKGCCSPVPLPSHLLCPYHHTAVHAAIGNTPHAPERITCIQISYQSYMPHSSLSLTGSIWRTANVPGPLCSAPPLGCLSVSTPVPGMNAGRHTLDNPTLPPSCSSSRPWLRATGRQAWGSCASAWQLGQRPRPPRQMQPPAPHGYVVCKPTCCMKGPAMPNGVEKEGVGKIQHAQHGRHDAMAQTNTR